MGRGKRRQGRDILSPEAAAGIEEKRRLGSLPPPECPSCRQDLTDPSVPEKYANYSPLFGIALQIDTATEGQAVWRCPFCNHTWQPHPKH